MQPPRKFPYSFHSTPHHTNLQCTCIHGNYHVDTLPIEGTTKVTIIPIPRIHIAHIIPYRLAKAPSSTNLAEMIRNLRIYIKKEHNKLTIGKAKPLQCANKWISKYQIHHNYQTHEKHNKLFVPK